MDQRLTRCNKSPSTVDDLISGLPQCIQQSIPSHLQSQPSLFLAQRLQSMGHPQQATLVLRLLVEAEPCNTEALYQLALTCNRVGNKHDALNYIKRHYEERMRANGMEPESNTDTLQYLLSTEGFAEPPVQIPRAYVENLFDRFSGQFDERLLQKLAYKIPELLFELFCKVAKNHGVLKNCKTLVDLGCGTGLAGKYFKSVCERLIGVDLSSEMIEKARLTGVYQELVVSEIVAYLQSNSLPIDVFIYFGELEAILKACRNRQNSDGLLAFSVEALASSNPQSEFQLAGSGRFQHHKQYVSSSAQNAGYVVLSCSQEVLRREGGCDVTGYLFVLIAK